MRIRFALMLPGLLDLLEQRGVRFVTLDEAERAPAHTAAPGQPAPSEGAPLARSRAAKPAAAPTTTSETMKRLADLCR